ncbi:MAG: YgeY family selenium metabolism-linked hydrolase [Candidatus Tectomicrobia bacterium]|nr:YgeY family selenium metabolism-linked hydrolase [Candidatus Tectomicrobia bacterium]
MPKANDRRALLAAAKSRTKDVVRFLRDLVAIPSPSLGEEKVARRVLGEMKRLRYDECWIDKLGNVIGRIGKGGTRLLLDAHIDTVGVGDPKAWTLDPFKGKFDGVAVYGRGSCDNKGAVAAQVVGAPILREVGLQEDFTLFVIGTVMEEDCDGYGLQFAMEKSLPRLDGVCLGEPTNMGVYRGHRGRTEIRVRAPGRSCHASAPERGVNPVYRMAPLVLAIERLSGRLKDDPFLGKGTVAVTKIDCETPSLNAVPDECTIYLDRRLTAGETLKSAVAEIRGLQEAKGMRVEVLDYVTRSYTGQAVQTEKYFPTWVLPEDHPLVRAGVEAARLALGRRPRVGRWVFSTNGVSSMGRLGVPTIGFGPGNEVVAHSARERCEVEQLVNAMAFYAAFPGACCRVARTGEGTRSKP